MGKAFIIAAAVVMGFIALATVGSISGGAGFDYATADYERKQKFLDGIADGFTTGFKLTAGKRAEVTQVFADASLDLVSVSVQYKDPEVENVSSNMVEKQRQFILKKTCRLAERQKLLENGITFRMRMYKPSGTQMGTIQVDNDACQPYIA